MNIETGQRTFFIAVSGTAPTTAYIPFLDTSGNRIKCNYVKISATNGSPAGNGFIAVELSGIPRIGSIANLQPVKLNTAIEASGIAGFGFGYGAGLAKDQEWHGSNGEVCVGVTLKLSAVTSGPNLFMVGITYGNLIGYSYLRSPMNVSGSMYDKGV